MTKLEELIKELKMGTSLGGYDAYAEKAILDWVNSLLPEKQQNVPHNLAKGIYIKGFNACLDTIHKNLEGGDG